MPPDPVAESGAAAPLRSYRGTHPAMAAIRRPPHARSDRPVEALQLIDIIIAGLLVLDVITTFTISPAMLTNWNIHNLTTAGNFYEKFHPATYFAFLAFCLLLIRNNDPIGEINRIFSEAKLVLYYLFLWLALLVQMLVLERPFTVIIDTFLLPVLLCLVVWELAPSQRRLLIGAVHLTVLVNVLLGY